MSYWISTQSLQLTSLATSQWWVFINSCVCMRGAMHCTHRYDCHKIHRMKLMKTQLEHGRFGIVDGWAGQHKRYEHHKAMWTWFYGDCMVSWWCWHLLLLMANGRLMTDYPPRSLKLTTQSLVSVSRFYWLKLCFSPFHCTSIVHSNCTVSTSLFIT